MDNTIYSVLFEAAKTPKEALKSGVAAIKVKTTNELAVLLLSTQRATRIINNTPEDNIDLALENQAVVGAILYKPVKGIGGGLYQVRGSAGINKFGPLTYQCVMKAIGPGWLKSDKHLSADSFFVWQKMYELSTKAGGGVYRRKWLGDFHPAYVHTVLSTASEHITSRDFLNIKEKIYDQNITTEKEVVKALGQYAPEIGCLWAYQLGKPFALIDKMFEDGKEIVALAERNGFKQSNFVIVADNFFSSKLYAQ